MAEEVNVDKSALVQVEQKPVQPVILESKVEKSALKNSIVLNTNVKVSA